MPKLDSIRLTYVGGPTVLIEIGSLRFLTDPTLDPPQDYQAGPFTHTKSLGPALMPEELSGVDAVLLSHDHHFDNLDHAGRGILDKAKQVLTTPAGATRLGGNAKGLETWQTVELQSGTGELLYISSTPARHGPEGNDRGPVTGFLISSGPEDPFQIYVSGDTVWYEGVEETIRRFPSIRLAILFVGAAQIPILPANLTFSAEDAVRVAKALPKATVIPVHFEGWKHLKESDRDVKQAFETAGLSNQVLWLPAGKPVSPTHREQ